MQNRETTPGLVWTRGPARPTTIRRIQQGLHGRVRLVGLLLNKEGDRFILDDGTGSIQVVVEEPGQMEGLSPGTKVRVIGRVLSSVEGDNPEIMGEIIQPMEKLDLALYREVYELREQLFEP